MRLVSVSQMNQLEKEANQTGLSYEEMMARAGHGLAEIIHMRYGLLVPVKVTGLVGSGNNGGDTLVALTHLAKWGWETHACLVKPRKADDPQLMGFQSAGGTIHTIREKNNDLEKAANLIETSDVLLDGVLGTGTQLPLRGKVKEILAFISARVDLPGAVVAVDCPSGVDCDSGEAAEECIPAELTVCMAAVKKGLLRTPALQLAGEITTVDIGLPDDLPGWVTVMGEVADDRMTAKMLPDRPLEAHKGTFGTAVIFAGSVNYPGAAMLAIQAAYRVGCGLVTGAVPEATYEVIAGHIPEATWLVMPSTMGAINKEAARIMLQHLQKVDAMLLGPGWGVADETLECLKELITQPKRHTGKSPMGFTSDLSDRSEAPTPALPPLIIDADGLKLLAKIRDWEKIIQSPTMLTPHPGEMAVLTGLGIDEIQKNREALAVSYAASWKKTIVLKGAATVIAAPNGRFTIIPVATSALATAGTGDVLAGMITGLIAQGLDPYSAGITAVWLHAQAGLFASKELGQPASVMAGDVIRHIPATLKKAAGIS